MATFDPTIGAHIQIGGGPATGGAPDLLAPFATAAAVAHITSAYEIKKDTNAAVRGQAAAQAHWDAIQLPLRTFKARHITDDNFDADYEQELNAVLERERTRSKYTAENEREQTSYNHTILNFKRSEMAIAFGEGMKAHHENQLAITNRVLDDLVNVYASTPNVLDAERIQGEIFGTLHNASQVSGRYPGIITPDQAVAKFDTTMRQAEISRLMSQMDRKSLFEMGHNPSSAIAIGSVDKDMIISGKYSGVQKVLPLVKSERDNMIAYAAQQFKQEKEILEVERSLNTEMSAIAKVVAERKFVDGIIANDEQSEQYIAGLQSMTTSNGTPMFDGLQVIHLAEYARTHKENRLKPIQVSDPTVLSNYIKQIYPENLDGGLNYSSYPLPDISVIEHDPHLTPSHKDSLVSGIHHELELRTNRDFTDFATKRSQAHAVLEQAFGGKGLIDLNPAMKTFFGEVENAFYARIDQKYSEATNAGTGLRSVDPLKIVNQILFEKGPAFHSVVYPQLKAQVKTLYRYVAAVPSNVPDDANPYAAVSDLILRDMAEPGQMPNRGGVLPNEEGIRLIQLLQAATAAGMKMGELREAMLQPFSLSLPSVPDLEAIGGKGSTKKPTGPVAAPGLLERLFPHVQKKD